MLYPYQIQTSIDLNNNLLYIKNKTDEDWVNIRISLTDSYAEEFFFCFCDFKSLEEKVLNFTNTLHFLNYEEGIDLRVSHENNLIYKRKIKEHRKRAIIIYSNKNFESIAEQLLIGLTRYIESDIIYYTIDFETDLDKKFPNLICSKINYEMDSELIADGQFMQMLKPQVFLKALEDGYEEIVFLDTDIQVTPNIKNIFSYFNTANVDTPILQRQFWHYVFANGSYVPGPLLMEELGYQDEKQFQGHGITNIFLFRKELKPLLEKWKYWCQTPNIVHKIRKEEFLHDELIFNLLTWKEKVKFKLVNFLFNVGTLKDVKVFETLKQDENLGWYNFNDIGLGHTSQSFAPFHKDDIIGYHCIKDPKIASDVNDYIFNKFRQNS